MTQRDTPATYSRAEAKLIREAAARGDDPLTCPRCGTVLELVSPDPSAATQMREAGCPGCSRCIMLPAPDG